MMRYLLHISLSLWLFTVGLLVVVMRLAVTLPDSGYIAMWLREGRDMTQVVWDLRTGTLAPGQVRPLGGILSPDGTLVVTAEYRSGETFLYRSPPDSLERTLIGRYDYDPTTGRIQWADDGQSIVLVDTFTALVTHIVRLDVQSGAAIASIWQEDITRVAQWSLDGRYVLLRNYVSNILGVAVRVVRVENGATVYLPLVNEIHWSPDSQRLAYQSIADPTTLNLYHVTSRQFQYHTFDRPDRLAIKALGLVWSPDSQRLVFTYNGNLYLYDVSSDSLDVLAEIKAAAHSWSPDGRYLLLDMLVNERSVLHIFDLENHTLIALDDITVRATADDTWSPTGHLLVLSEINGNMIAVNVVDAATGRVQSRLNFSTGRYRPVYVEGQAVAQWQESLLPSP